ncbi:MAG: OmpA family protein [Opitutae bacterium]|nr:OmpA family protein [Opitutae bacterium]
MKCLRFPLFVLFALMCLSCAKNSNPETTHNLNTGSNNSESAGNNGFNSVDDNDFADLGTPIRGSFEDDGLSERNPASSSFNGDNVFRPFEPVLFGFDQFNIKPPERDKISKIAQYMLSEPSAKLLIEGYCDWKGTPDYNKSLGDRRAKTVKDYLIDLGCDENRIEIISIGDELAIPNATPDVARLDRRATFVVSK